MEQDKVYKEWRRNWLEKLQLHLNHFEKTWKLSKERDDEDKKHDFRSWCWKMKFDYREKTMKEALEITEWKKRRDWRTKRNFWEMKRQRCINNFVSVNSASTTCTDGNLSDDDVTYYEDDFLNY